MKSAAWWAVCGAGLLALVGCGSKSDGDATATAPRTSTAATQTTTTTAVAAQKSIAIAPEVAAKIAGIASPDQAVAAFLSAMRDGDEQTITALLSEPARQATAQHDQLAIQPPGSPDASYRVGTVELVGEDQSGAHVVSIWTERDQTGAPVEYEVVWVLRREQAGWRVAGMATLVEENQPPLFLNFEDPEEMLALLTAAQDRSPESEPAAVQAQNLPANQGTIQR